MLPLTDTLVLDLTQVIAGPTAGQILGDMGADVIKVEPLHCEHFRPQFCGAWVPSMNRNKRWLALDLRTPGGREVLMRLARKADVFMEAFTPGVIDKLGFGWDVVSNENPRLVYASISGYGQTGPYAARAGYDPCIQAEVGLIEVPGTPGVIDPEPATYWLPCGSVSCRVTWRVPGDPPVAVKTARYVMSPPSLL